MDVKLSYRKYLSVFQNKVLRRMYVPTREEILENWRQFHKKELRNQILQYNGTRIMRMRSLERVACMGAIANAYQF
jgi:hypothetical protein